MFQQEVMHFHSRFDKISDFIRNTVWARRCFKLRNVSRLRPPSISPIRFESWNSRFYICFDGNYHWNSNDVFSMTWWQGIFFSTDDIVSICARYSVIFCYFVWKQFRSHRTWPTQKISHSKNDVIIKSSYSYWIDKEWFDWRVANTRSLMWKKSTSIQMRRWFGSALSVLGRIFSSILINIIRNGEKFGLSYAKRHQIFSALILIPSSFSQKNLLSPLRFLI